MTLTLFQYIQQIQIEKKEEIEEAFILYSVWWCVSVCFGRCCCWPYVQLLYTHTQKHIYRQSQSLTICLIELQHKHSYRKHNQSKVGLTSQPGNRRKEGREAVYREKETKMYQIVSRKQKAGSLPYMLFLVSRMYEQMFNKDC